MVKKLLRKLTPKRALLFYHYLKAETASIKHANPSKGMIVIGVTGTKGKSSTANFIWAGLSGAGVKTGLQSTANLKIGTAELENRYHMTMPNPFAIQANLKRMAAAGCKIAIVETTSEGILQSRHKGINYDILVFTNLTPEHITSHGTFENYKATKQRLFKELKKQPHKTLAGVEIPKTIIINSDSPHADDFLKFPADHKFTYGISSNADFKAEDIRENERNLSFGVSGRRVELKIPGVFNVLNALPVFPICRILGLSVEDAIRGLETLTAIPGRMETIIEKPFRVIVDYAHEKESMTALMETAQKIKGGGKIIVLLGAEGGGRDKTKRPLMGSIVGQQADYVVVSNVDPYEESPMNIINDIAAAAKEEGKIENRDLFLIEDRRAGIKKCLELAAPGDLVLITGKGSEQSMIIGNQRIAWDDRRVVKELFGIIEK